MIVTKRFFNAPTSTLARDVLGTFLVHHSPEGLTVGRIVETEAYLYRDDPACHAHKGKTKRNAVMFGPAGFAYVYLIYGMYYCFNVSSGPVGEGEAVLIRALEPIEGIDLMKARREREKLTDLCSGPGKLVIALGITAQHNGLCLRTSALQLHRPSSFRRKFRGSESIEVVTTTRIGISKGETLPLRFYIRGNPFISKP